MQFDLRPTPSAVRLCVEQYGSLAHLAEALGVTPERMRAWMQGAEAVPLDKFRVMLETVATKGS